MSHRSLFRFIGRRLLFIPISAIVVATVSFGLMHVLPLDPTLLIAGEFANEERIAEIRSELGRDRPVIEQYRAYVGDLARGDLGNSYFSGQSNWSEVRRHLPNSIELVGVAMLFASALGLLLGGATAYWRDRFPDRLGRTLVTIFQSTPDFLVALLLIYVLFLRAGLAPAPIGRLGVLEGSVEGPTGFLLIDTLLAGRRDLFLSAVHRILLPAASLGVVYSAYLAKVGRSTIGEALDSRYVEYARACGLSELRVFRYALMTARVPLITYGVILIAGLVGGAVIVESIFSWGGFAEWGLRAMLTGDLPSIQAFVFVTGVLAVTAYLILDIVVLMLDPRVRYEKVT